MQNAPNSYTLAHISTNTHFSSTNHPSYTAPNGRDYQHPLRNNHGRARPHDLSKHRRTAGDPPHFIDISPKLFTSTPYCPHNFHAILKKTFCPLKFLVSLCFPTIIH